MQMQASHNWKPCTYFGRKINGEIDRATHFLLQNSISCTSVISSSHLKARTARTRKFDLMIHSYNFQPSEIRHMAADDIELSSDDDELCPVECVKEFKTDEEFTRILEKAKQTGSLVVVDFYRTSCGSCKYIEQGFAKLCKGSGDEEAPVIFLKHNVIDEYDEQSEVADRLRIRSVPLFHFYKDGVLLEAFPTRDKERILAAILKYTAAGSKNP